MRKSEIGLLTTVEFSADLILVSKPKIFPFTPYYPGFAPGFPVIRECFGF